MVVKFSITIYKDFGKRRQRKEKVSSFQAANPAQQMQTSNIYYRKK